MRSEGTAKPTPNRASQQGAEHAQRNLDGDFFMYCIHYCFICRPSDSTVSEDAGIEPRTVVTTALTVRSSNHSAHSGIAVAWSGSLSGHIVQGHIVHGTYHARDALSNGLGSGTHRSGTHCHGIQKLWMGREWVAGNITQDQQPLSRVCLTLL